jgi:hypothetical protein
LGRVRRFTVSEPNDLHLGQPPYFVIENVQEAVEEAVGEVVEQAVGGAVGEAEETEAFAIVYQVESRG